MFFSECKNSFHLNINLLSSLEWNGLTDKIAVSLFEILIKCNEITHFDLDLSLYNKKKNP